MAVYPKQTSPKPNRDSQTEASPPPNGNGQISAEHLSVAIENLRSHLEEAGVLTHPQARHYWQQLEQFSTHAQQSSSLPLLERPAQQQLKHQREQLLETIGRMRACSSRNALLEATVTQLQQALKVERTVICQVKGNSKAVAIAESMVPGYTPLSHQTLPLGCFGVQSAAEYRDRPFEAVANTDEAGWSPYIRQTLERFQIKSQCCVPILLDGQVWGFLVAQRTSQPRPWQEIEINLLLGVATELTALLQPLKFRYQLQQQAEQEKTYDKIVEDVRAEDAEIDKLFLNTCQEVRQSLRADRALIYRFNLDWSGEVIAESVGRSWVSLLVEQEQDEVLKGNRTGDDRSILKAWAKGSNAAHDTYLERTQGGAYARGQKFTCVNDIYAAGFSACYLDTLEKYQVRAYIIVPIYHENRLWGLLGVYQNSGPRLWQESEIQLMARLSAPLGVALQKSATRDQLALQSQKLSADAKRELAFIDTVERLWQSLDSNTLFQTSVDEVRQLLCVDRVTLYRFETEKFGELVAESVAKEWQPLTEARGRAAIDTATGENPYDLHIQEIREEFGKKDAAYQRLDDFERAGLPPSTLNLLEKLQAKAYVIVPVFQPKKKTGQSPQLWGILGVYQNSQPREWQQAELNVLVQLAKQLNVAVQQAEYVTQLEQQSQTLAQTAERDRAIAKIIDRIRSTSDLSSIFRNTTQELRRLFEADRALVYRFKPDWSGEVASESVASGWVSLLSEQKNDEVLRGDRIATDRCILRTWSTSNLVEDTYLQQTQGGRYRRGQAYTCINDIYQQDFPRCYIESLEKYQARAYMIVPIFQGETLWGLLGIYQNSGPRHWQETEINLLLRVATPLGLALQQAEAIARLSNQAKQEQVLSKLLEKIQQAPGVDSIFRATCQEIRQLLSVDRALIYRFNPDMSGEVVAESVGGGWVSLLIEQEQDEILKGDRIQTDRCILRKWAIGSIIERDSYMQETGGGKYARGAQFTRVDDIYTMGFPTCYLDTLEKYQARAYMIVPIFQNDKLWGLLGAYQNSSARTWEEEEVQLLVRVSVPLGVALQQAEVLERLSQQSAQMSTVAEREKSAKELLQQRAVQLLMSIRPSFEGDLTVRAPITDDEMGTIADAYNNTIQSLRRIVVQVKQAADNVGQTSIESEVAIEALSTRARGELQALGAALQQIQSMVTAAETVSESAQKVEFAVQTARSTVQAGDTAMNRTVDGFSEIRKTVAETSQKIKRLGESSQKITKVVNLISNFATQTNLLALNAAIEATRAGEYGRGFAVVADEVRSLARQSEEATSEIEKLVLEIQQETSEVAAAMDRGIQQVVSGTNLVNETRSSLTEIVEATAQISQLVDHITQSTRVQTQQSQSVTQTMEELAAIARSTSESAIQISASFQALLTTAEELQANVGQFKVN
jgi:methyl-accepting chemotaxis protein PixJ